MYEDEGPKWIAQCEEKGIDWARAQLDHLNPGITVHIREWLHKKDRESAEFETAESRRFTQEAIDAAKESAAASKSAAKWTMIAALISCVGVIVTAVLALLSH